MADSPQEFDVEADGEEEPLFADDITDDEDDPPPLPPPLPSLGELSAMGRQTGQASATPGSGGVFPDTQRPAGSDGPAANDQEPPQKKRKPMLTLTIDRIFSDKGLSYVEKEFPKLKFRGKGHEASDLKYLLQQYEQWANMLYPKLTFKDVTDRIEALASKKEFKSQLLLMRRRAARGGRATPPLPSDDSDDERGGARNHEEGQRLPGEENGTLPRSGDGSNEENSISGATNQMHQDSEHVSEGSMSGCSEEVGGATKVNGDCVGGAGSGSRNSALDRLTLDAYGFSSDED